MPPDAHGLLIIMAKQPRPGRVKTRLSPPLAAADVLTLYEAFLADTIAVVAAACRLAGGVTPALAYTPADAHDYFRARVPAGFVLLPQQGADLGARLAGLPAQAAARAFHPVAMISSDSPTLPPAVVAGAFVALARPGVDAVLGPCHDGGYYLIGVHRPQPALFTGIPWSTERVTAATLAAAERAALTVALLPAWSDVDTAEDLVTLRAELQADPAAAPQTRAVLTALARRAATPAGR